MKRLLLSCSLLAAAVFAKAQITIQNNTVASVNDTFRYSIPDSNIYSAAANTGANISWDFSALRVDTQDILKWQKVTDVNVSLVAFGIPSTAYGYKVTDSVTYSNITLENPYSFFLKNSDTFSAVGYGVTMSGLTIGAPYQDKDEYFIFPLNYNDHDSTTFAFSMNLAGNYLRGRGYRNTYVDGWGTIKTPYYTTATNVLRVRSVATEIDSISFNGNAYVIPRVTTDYYWLTQNDKFPAMWIETVSLNGVMVPMFTRYRDVPRAKPTGINNVSAQKVTITTYPNPSNGIFHIDIPAGWHQFAVEVYDLSGKLVAAQSGKADIDLSKQPSGDYLVRTSNGAGQVGFTMIQKL